MKKVIITGAHSFIGTSLARFLAKWPRDYRVEMVTIRGGVREISFKGADVIVHLAGIARVSRAESMKKIYYEVNRDLAAETAKRAKADGVKHFIFMSSMMVYGAKVQKITEQTQPAPSNAYGESKIQAERAISNISDENFSVSIIRAPLVYGPGCRGNFPKLLNLARFARIFPDVDNRRTMIFVEDLAEYIKRIIDGASVGVFLPRGYDVAIKDIIVKYRALDGKKTTLVKLPSFAVRAMLKSSLGAKVFRTRVYAEVPALMDDLSFQHSLERMYEYTRQGRNSHIF